MIHIKKKIFYSIIVLGLFLHALSLFLPLYDDAAAMGIVLQNIRYSPKLILLLYSHFVLGFIFYIGSTSVLGISDLTIRLVPLLFNFMSFFLIYKLTKIIYNRKLAKIVLLLCFFTFLPFFTGTIVDIDGSIVVFFSLLSYYSLYRYFKLEKKNKWLLIFLFSAGILTSFKTRVFFILGSFVILFFIYSDKNITSTFRYTLLLGISVLTFFILNLFVVWLLDDSLLLFFIERLINHSGPQGNIFYIIKKVYSVLFIKSIESGVVESSQTLVTSLGSNPLRYLNLMVSLTPLYIFLPLAQLIKNKKDDFLLLVWLLPVPIYLVAYPLGILREPRYLSIFYPPLLLLSARWIFGIKKVFKKMRITTVNRLLKIFFFGNLFLLTTYFMINAYSQEMWFLSVSTGPIIEISKLTLLAVFFVSTLCFALFYILKNKKFSFFVLNIFFIIVLSFNLFLILIPITDKTHKELVLDIEEFAIENEVTEPVFSWNEDVPYYMNIENLPYLHLDNPLKEKMVAVLNKKEAFEFVDLTGDFTRLTSARKGTVVLLNYPINKFPEINISKYNNQCKLSSRNSYSSGSVAFYKC